VTIAKKVKGVLLTLIAALLYFFLAETVPQFSQTFNLFDADLPGMTSFFLDMGPVYVCLSCFSLIFFAGWLIIFLGGSFSKKRYYSFIKYNFIFSLVVFLCAMVAMYLPIFSLGNTI